MKEPETKIVLGSEIQRVYSLRQYRSTWDKLRLATACGVDRICLDEVLGILQNYLYKATKAKKYWYLEPIAQIYDVNAAGLPNSWTETDMVFCPFCGVGYELQFTYIADEVEIVCGACSGKLRLRGKDAV